MIGAGAGARTVGSIIDRLLVQVLTPPDGQGAQVELAADVTDTMSGQILLGSFTVPEDEWLLRQGSLLELGQELVRVISYNETSHIVTVTRGEYGTEATTHQRPLLINLSPPYPRAVVFEAVADNIIQLYPSLFTVGQLYLTPISDGAYPIEDPLAVEVLSVTEDFTSTRDMGGKIVDFHPLVGGRTLVTDSDAGSVWLRYRRRMARATSESDLLAEIGVDDRWLQIVLVGAAADLMVGRDVPEMKTEWVRSVLEAENIRVGTRMSIAGGLRQYRDILMREAMAEQKAEYRPRVQMRPVIGGGI